MHMAPGHRPLDDHVPSHGEGENNGEREADSRGVEPWLSHFGRINAGCWDILGAENPKECTAVSLQSR